MSIITKIDGVPLFSKKEEALRYARLNNIFGYHTHTHFGKTGYMGGKNHFMEPDVSIVPLTEILAQPNIDQDPRNVLMDSTPTDGYDFMVTFQEQLEGEIIDQDSQDILPERPLVTQQESTPVATSSGGGSSSSGGGGGYSGGGGGGY